MNEWVVKDVDTGDTWHKDSHNEAQQAIDEFGDVRNLEIIPPEGENADPVTAEPVPDQQDPVETLPDEKPGLEDDPVDWMPSHFIDEIQGVPTLNRKGYAVMAERFNVSVTSEPVVRASESDFEYAEFRATATTEDGTEYSGFGSAHVDRDTGKGGDDEYLLNEMAETRAMKRAASWALGLGMTAREEMM